MSKDVTTMTLGRRTGMRPLSPSKLLLSHSQWKDFLAVFHQDDHKAARVIRIPFPRDATTLLLRGLGLLR